MEFLTHTKRRDFLNCPRYFFHRHEQGLALRGDKAGRRRGTIFGEAIQVARDWEHALTLGAPDDVLGNFASGIEVAVDHIEVAYEALRGTMALDQEASDELDLEEVKMAVIVSGYIERYGQKPRREVEFDFPLINPRTGGASRTFRRAGKLDGLEIIDAKKKQARVVEDKLMQQIQKSMIDRLPLDMQSNEYVDALLSRGWDATVAYRHTRWPGINPAKERVLKTKTVPAETLAEFADRLRQDLIDRREFYFDEQIVFFPKEQLEDYRAGRYGTAKMIMHARVVGREDWQMGFPMNPSRCWEYGGCEFIPLCTKRPDAADLYVIVEDNQELSTERSSNAADEYGHETA